MAFSGKTTLCKGYPRWVAAWVLLLWAAGQASAAKLVLRVRAGNPSATQRQTVPIKSNLPPRARPRDVITTSGLDLGYDVQNDIYYVHKKVALEPKQIEVYNVEIQDIWLIPEKAIASYRERVQDLAKKLVKTRHRDVSGELKIRILGTLDDVAEEQDAARIGPGVKPTRHISVYEANREKMERVRRDIGRMENLVLATGQDPGPLMGTVRTPSKSQEVRIPEGGYKAVIFRITAKNPSPKFKKNFPLRSDLPPEIKARDILDPGKLSVGIDPKTDVTYVYKHDLGLEPEEEKVFDVKLRDKWNINEPRITALEIRGKALQDQVTAVQRYTSLMEGLGGIQTDLAAIRKETGPEPLSPEDVAFYRDQSARIDLIEKKLLRIEDALKPVKVSSKLGFDIPAPSSKTTWLLIYIILGFLGVVSLLFFFRWYGRSKAEDLSV